MKGLLIKDFKLIKGQQSFLLIIIAISILTTIGDTSFVTTYLSIMGSMFTLSTLSYDEFDNGNAFLFSLPITRTDYILEKYGFALITSVGFWLSGIVIATVAQIFKSTSVTFTQDIIMPALITLPVLFIILAVMFPFQLKFGSEKGRIAIVAVAGAVAFIGVIVFKIAEKFNLDLNFIGSYLQGTDIKILILFVIAASVLALFISFKASLAIIYKKEF